MPSRSKEKNDNESEDFPISSLTEDAIVDSDDSFSQISNVSSDESFSGESEHSSSDTIESNSSASRKLVKSPAKKGSKKVSPSNVLNLNPELKTHDKHASFEDNPQDDNSIIGSSVHVSLNAATIAGQYRPQGISGSVHPSNFFLKNCPRCPAIMATDLFTCPECHEAYPLPDSNLVDLHHEQKKNVLLTYADYIPPIIFSSSLFLHPDVRMAVSDCINPSVEDLEAAPLHVSGWWNQPAQACLISIHDLEPSYVLKPYTAICFSGPVIENVPSAPLVSRAALIDLFNRFPHTDLRTPHKRGRGRSKKVNDSTHHKIDTEFDVDSVSQVIDGNSLLPPNNNENWQVNEEDYFTQNPDQKPVITNAPYDPFGRCPTGKRNPFLINPGFGVISSIALSPPISAPELSHGDMQGSRLVLAVSGTPPFDSLTYNVSKTPIIADGCIQFWRIDGPDYRPPRDSVSAQLSAPIRGLTGMFAAPSPPDLMPGHAALTPMPELRLTIKCAATTPKTLKWIPNTQRANVRAGLLVALMRDHSVQVWDIPDTPFAEGLGGKESRHLVLETARILYKAGGVNKGRLFSSVDVHKRLVGSDGLASLVLGTVAGVVDVVVLSVKKLLKGYYISEELKRVNEPSAFEWGGHHGGDVGMTEVSEGLDEDTGDNTYTSRVYPSQEEIENETLVNSLFVSQSSSAVESVTWLPTPTPHLFLLGSHEGTLEFRDATSHSNCPVRSVNNNSIAPISSLCASPLLFRVIATSSGSLAFRLGGRYATNETNTIDGRYSVSASACVAIGGLHIIFTTCGRILALGQQSALFSRRLRSSDMIGTKLLLNLQSFSSAASGRVDEEGEQALMETLKPAYLPSWDAPLTTCVGLHALNIANSPLDEQLVVHPTALSESEDSTLKKQNWTDKPVIDAEVIDLMKFERTRRVGLYAFNKLRHNTSFSISTRPDSQRRPQSSRKSNSEVAVDSSIHTTEDSASHTVNHSSPKKSMNNSSRPEDVSYFRKWLCADSADWFTYFDPRSVGFGDNLLGHRDGHFGGGLVVAGNSAGFIYGFWMEDTGLGLA